MKSIVILVPCLLLCGCATHGTFDKGWGKWRRDVNEELSWLDLKAYKLEHTINMMKTTNSVAYVATLEIIDSNGNTNRFTWGSQPKP